MSPTVLLKDQSKQTLIRALLFTFGFGLVAHGYAFLHFQPSHDSLFEMFTDRGDWKIALGRYLKPVYDALFGYFASVPWTTGLAALFWMALTAFLLCEILEIRRSWQIAVICGILTTHISVIAMVATYMQDLGADMLALLFAMLGCWFWHKMTLLPAEKGKRKLVVMGVAAACCLAASMALYQAFICVFITMVLIKSIVRILQSTGSVWKEVLKDISAAALTTIVGGGEYYLGLKAATHIADVSLASGSYNSVTNLLDNSEPVTKRIQDCLHVFKQLLLQVPGYVYANTVPQTINLLLILLGAVCLAGILLHLAKQQGALGNIVTALLLTACLPFTMNGMRLLSHVVHLLMMYAFCLLYIFIFAVVLRFAEIYKNQIVLRAVKGGAAILLFCIFFVNIQVANAAYVKKTTEQTATLSVMTRVVDRIESLDGYEPGVTPVLFVGIPSTYLYDFSPFHQLSWITGMYERSSVSYWSAYANYLHAIMKVDVNLMDESTGYAAVGQETIDSMPSFPQNGSIQEINDVVVVKFPDLVV